jgi:hypothetical protein
MSVCESRVAATARLRSAHCQRSWARTTVDIFVDKAIALTERTTIGSRHELGDADRRSVRARHHLLLLRASRSAGRRPLSAHRLAGPPRLSRPLPLSALSPAPGAGGRLAPIELFGNHPAAGREAGSPACRPNGVHRREQQQHEDQDDGEIPRHEQGHGPPSGHLWRPGVRAPAGRRRYARRQAGKHAKGRPSRGGRIATAGANNVRPDSAGWYVACMTGRVAGRPARVLTIRTTGRPFCARLQCARWPPCPRRRWSTVPRPSAPGWLIALASFCALAVVHAAGVRSCRQPRETQRVPSQRRAAGPNLYPLT